MLKAFVKTGIAAVLGWTGADRAVSSLTGTMRLPLVVGYHAVVEDVRAHVGRAIAPNPDPASTCSNASWSGSVDDIAS